MKALLIILVSAFGISSFAGEFSKPLNVNFQAASTFVQATKVCRNGDMLQHVSKDETSVEICDESDSGSEYNCRIVSKPLIQPVVSTAQRCAKTASDSSNGRCLVWETYTLNQSSVKVISYNSLKEMEDGRNGKVTGKFVIPSCR